MGNLREKKKEDRKIRIQNAAIELFGSIGYKATTIARIAEDANLGVGTFYNYYKSKEQVLISIISDKAEEFTTAFDYAIQNYTTDILYSVNLLIDVYYNSFTIYNKLIWCEFISNVFGTQHNTIDMIKNIDSLFINKLIELLICLKKDGVIKKNIDEFNTANTLYSILVFQLLMYVLDENMTIDYSRKSLNDQIIIVTLGLK